MRVKGFCAWRPAADRAEEVASVPYDVVNREQAKALAQGNPNSFLHVVRAEIGLPDTVDIYADEVYAAALKNLTRFQEEGILIREEEPSVYLYSQRMGEHVQYGIVAGCHIEDYEEGHIKIHEKDPAIKRGRSDSLCGYAKREHRTCFLAYRDSATIQAEVDRVKQTQPLYHFTASDGVEHTVWRFEETASIEEGFAAISALYVADGHHRSASAAKVGAKRRAANPAHTGNESYNYFLSVLFPESELNILAYNRVVLSLPDSVDAFREALSTAFTIEANGVDTPREAGEMCMYLEEVGIRFVLVSNRM